MCTTNPPPQSDSDILRPPSRIYCAHTIYWTLILYIRGTAYNRLRTISATNFDTQLVMEPLSRRSLLLAPTEIPVAPLAICQLCDGTSHTEKSRRESVSETVVDCPGARKMLSNPCRFSGADCADAGGDVYSCGICRDRGGQNARLWRQLQDAPYLRACDGAVVGDGEGDGDHGVVQPVKRRVHYSLVVKTKTG